jgi:hypothetical protein
MSGMLEDQKSYEVFDYTWFPGCTPSAPDILHDAVDAL